MSALQESTGESAELGDQGDVKDRSDILWAVTSGLWQLQVLAELAPFHCSQKLPLSLR